MDVRECEVEERGSGRFLAQQLLKTGYVRGSEEREARREEIEC